LPDVSCGFSQGVAFQNSRGASRVEVKEAELAEIGDEDQAVLAEIAEGLRFGCERVEAVVGGLDFYDAAFRVAGQIGLGIAALAFGLGKESAVWEARADVAELCREEDGWVE
jgi:hypothetical protein